MGDTFGKSSAGLTDSQTRNRNLVKFGADATSSALTGQPINPNNYQIRRRQPKAPTVNTLDQSQPNRITPPGVDVGPTPAADINPGGFANNAMPPVPFAVKKQLPFYGY